MHCFQKLINCWQRCCPASHQSSQWPGQTSLDRSAWPEEWFTKPFPERSSPLGQEINLISSVCACVYVYTQYFTKSNNAVISLSSVFPKQESARFYGLVRSCDAACPSPDPFSIHPIPLEIPGKLFRRIKPLLRPFPKLVVMTLKTLSLYFTKQVSLAIWGKILIKI